MNTENSEFDNSINNKTFDDVNLLSQQFYKQLDPTMKTRTSIYYISIHQRVVNFP